MTVANQYGLRVPTRPSLRRYRGSSARSSSVDRRIRRPRGAAHPSGPRSPRRGCATGYGVEWSRPRCRRWPADRTVPYFITAPVPDGAARILCPGGRPCTVTASRPVPDQAILERCSAVATLAPLAETSAALLDLPRSREPAVNGNDLSGHELGTSGRGRPPRPPSSLPTPHRVGGDSCPRGPSTELFVHIGANLPERSLSPQSVHSAHSTARAASSRRRRLRFRVALTSCRPTNAKESRCRQPSGSPAIWVSRIPGR